MSYGKCYTHSNADSTQCVLSDCAIQWISVNMDTKLSSLERPISWNGVTQREHCETVTIEAQHNHIKVVGVQ